VYPVTDRAPYAMPVDPPHEFTDVVEHSAARGSPIRTVGPTRRSPAADSSPATPPAPVATLSARSWRAFRPRAPSPS
jgi:hypothetical protein